MTEAGQTTPAARAARCGGSRGVAVTRGNGDEAIVSLGSGLVRACLIEYSIRRNVFVCPDTVGRFCSLRFYPSV